MSYKVYLEPSPFQAEQPILKVKKDSLTALSISYRASKLTNLNSIYQLSLLLLPKKNKSLQAVLKTKLLRCQYFPSSASWPAVLFSFNLSFHGVPRSKHEGLCQSVFS